MCYSLGMKPEPRIQNGPVVVRTPAQWAAMTSPVRLEIVECLRCLGPSAVPIVAQALARPADGLYHHFRLLERAGLLEQAGFERVGKHTQAIYRLVGTEIVLDYEFHSLRNAARMRAVASSAARAAERGLSEAIRAGGLLGPGPRRDFGVQILAARLTEPEVKQVRRLFRSVRAIIDRGLQRRSGRSYGMFYAMWPTPEVGPESATTRTRTGRRARMGSKAGSDTGAKSSGGPEAAAKSEGDGRAGWRSRSASKRPGANR